MGVSDVAGKISLRPPVHEGVRDGGRLLAMVHELHKAGYQKLRIYPGMAPSGCHWRCDILAVSEIDPATHRPLKPQSVEARYSSSQKRAYFGWTDAGDDSARELAVKFIARFPALIEAGRGADWPYAGWFTQMLGFAEQSHLPTFYADYLVTLPPHGMPPV